MVHLADPTKRDIVFLLGAGAVYDAGLPTAVGLTNCVEKALADEYPTLLPVLRFVSGAVQFGKACQGEPPNDRINIEELLTACSFLATRERSEVYPFVGAWHEQISRLQPLPKGIQSHRSDSSFGFLAGYCRQGLHDWLAIEDSAMLQYLQGFRDFIDAGYRLRIFTLNYDECIERALTDALGDVNSSWTTGFGQAGWNPSLLDSDKRVAYVYKLHGSLDWVRDPKLGICSVRWPPARDSEELPEDFDAFLVFGTDVKLQAVDPFLTLLFRFQQLLNHNDVIVVVGYSFGDHHVNAMILEALQRDPQMRCVVVNTHGLEELLPDDSDFARLVAVEQRFVLVKGTAKDAFESTELLGAVQRAQETREEELPF